MMYLSNPTNSKAKQRWKNAIDKFKHAIVLEKYDIGKLNEELSDCVRVKIAQSIKEDKLKPYLEEIATGTHTYDEGSYLMLRMDEKGLTKRQLFYDKYSKKLVDSNKEIATTIGKSSKHQENLQAFVMSKEGNLYYGTHTGSYGTVYFNLTHASFLKGKPLEMAGMISIYKGKIELLSSNSGHYTPEALDMYRGIKKLQTLMPGVISPNCKIKYQDNRGNHEEPLTQFINFMEEITSNGKSHHQELREKRISDIKQYTINLKNAVSININSNQENLGDALAKLDLKVKTKLVEGLTIPLASITLFKKGKKPENFSIEEALRSVISSGNVQAMEVLLNSGVSKRKDFQQEDSIYQAAISQNLEMMEVMLKDPDIRQSLANQKGQPNTILHIVAAYSNPENVNKMLDVIFKYPEGRSLLGIINSEGYTPIQFAYHKSNREVSDLLISKYLPIAQLQIVEYFAQEFSNKKILIEEDKNAMKQKITEILKPLAISPDEEKDFQKHIGTLVRKAATNMNLKLDFKQRITLIKDEINDLFNKIFSNKKDNMLKDLVKKSNIKQTLEKLSKQENLNNYNKELCIPTTKKNNDQKNR